MYTVPISSNKKSKNTLPVHTNQNHQILEPANTDRIKPIDFHHIFTIELEKKFRS